MPDFFEKDKNQNQSESQPSSETPTGLARSVRFFDDATNQSISPMITEQLRYMKVPFTIEGVTDRVQKMSASESAEKQKHPAVLALRIEADKRQVNDNLSALVKIGLQIFQAMLRGQHLVLSIAPGFEATIANADPGVAAQYQALRLKIDRLSVTRPESFTLLPDSDVVTFCRGVQQALENQSSPENHVAAINDEQLNIFEAARSKRLAKKTRSVTVGGSSTAYNRLQGRRFQNNQRLVRQVWEEAGDVTALNEGHFERMWTEAYEEKDPIKRSKLMRQAFLSEQGHKDHNDIVVWMVQNEAVSKAATTEIGFLLLNAFESGQQLSVLLEPFNVDQYIQHLIKKNLVALKLQFPTEPLLAQAEQNIQNVTMEKVAESSLSDSREYKEAEMAMKVRRSVEHELVELQATISEVTGEHGVELFSLATDVTECIQKARLVSNPESAVSRAEYYKNFDTFKLKLTAEVAAHRGDRSQAVSAIRRALDATVATQPDAPLHKHLQETVDTVVVLTPAASHTDAEHQTPYLSAAEMKLLTEVVTPIHDLLKFLGSPGSQALPDHEVLISYIADEFLPDLGYTSEEVEFVSRVLANHENIYKEKGRDEFSRSESPVEKAMSLFFMADVLTGAIVVREGGVYDLDKDKLEIRLSELYFRHLDPVQRKISLPRPEWGLYSVKDLTELCKTLRDQHGVKFTDSFIPSIIDAAIEGIRRTLDANGARAENVQNTEPRLSDSEIMDIMDARTALQEMRAEFA